MHGVHRRALEAAVIQRERAQVAKDSYDLKAQQSHERWQQQQSKRSAGIADQSQQPVLFLHCSLVNAQTGAFGLINSN